jgi:hypothetical protein
MKARLLLRRKLTDRDGDLLEWIVWIVPASPLYRDGVRYRMAFVPWGIGKPVVLYDNHHPKGHHKHLEDLEQPYTFSGIDQLLVDFENDVRVWKKASGRYP